MEFDDEMERILENSKAAAEAERQAFAAAHPEIWAALGELYTPHEAWFWLMSFHPMLGGKTANRVIAEGGTKRVLRLIAAMSDGTYV